MQSIFAHPPVPATGQRALMARFSHGEDHRRRRGYALDAIAAHDAAQAQETARAETLKAATGTVDVIPLCRNVIERIFEVHDEIADPEIAAARLSLAVQAVDATTGLIANALLGGGSLKDTLEHDPPVRNTRRVVDGEEVVVDLAGRPFGGEPRPCPGQELALAIAQAILDVLRTGRLLPFDGVYEDWPNLRIPARLEVRF